MASFCSMGTRPLIPGRPLTSGPLYHLQMASFWPALEHVVSSQGQPWPLAHCSAFKWPPRIYSVTCQYKEHWSSLCCCYSSRKGCATAGRHFGRPHARVVASDVWVSEIKVRLEAHQRLNSLKISLWALGQAFLKTWPASSCRAQRFLNVLFSCCFFVLWALLSTVSVAVCVVSIVASLKGHWPNFFNELTKCAWRVACLYLIIYIFMFMSYYMS